MYLSNQDRVVLLLHEGIDGDRGKTGIAFARYRPQSVVAVIDAKNAGRSFSELTGLDSNAPIVASVADSLVHSPTALLIGIAPSGGALPPEWQAEVVVALDNGLSIVNGLHSPMAALLPRTQIKALKSGQWIWDMRKEPEGLVVGLGRAADLSARRILTVGTDMAIGKMSTALEFTAAATMKNLRAKCVATGQAGIMITGAGVCLDAVRVDFASGAIEAEMLKAADEADLLFVEGQGSVLHPSSTATLPLIRGSQPTELVLVHRLGQTHLLRAPNVRIPPLKEVISVYESLASAGGAFAPCKVKAIAINSFRMSPEEAEKGMQAIHDETGLPVDDVVRNGGSWLLDQLLAV
jgi:uncharacterized NAD-dependent epimerase/dehydratase family protein